MTDDTQPSTIYTDDFYDRMSLSAVNQMTPDALRKMLRHEIKTGSPEMLRRMAKVVGDREGRRLRREQMAAEADRDSLIAEVVDRASSLSAAHGTLALILRDGQ